MKCDSRRVSEQKQAPVFDQSSGGTCSSDRCYPKLPLVDAECAGLTRAFSSPWEIVPDGGGMLSSAAWLAPREQTDARASTRSFSRTR